MRKRVYLEIIKAVLCVISYQYMEYVDKVNTFNENINYINWPKKWKKATIIYQSHKILKCLLNINNKLIFVSTFSFFAL